MTALISSRPEVPVDIHNRNPLYLASGHFKRHGDKTPHFALRQNESETVTTTPCSRPLEQILIEHSDAFSSQTCSGILSRVIEPPRIHLGTSSFTAAGWSGSFYPKGLKHSEYLAFYSEHFDSVEIDSTFYACPSPSTIRADDFIFSVKVPQTIT